VISDHFAGNRKTQATPVGRGKFSAGNAFPKGCKLCRRNAASVILHLNGDHRINTACGNTDVSIVPDMARRILDQIGES